MTQIIRPIADTNVNNVASGTFEDINEFVANDANFVYTTPNFNTIYETKLAAPRGRQYDSIVRVHYRAAKVTSTGLLSSGGADVSIGFEVREGNSVLRGSTGSSNLNGSFGERSSAFALNNVNDWSDIRIRFLISANLGAFNPNRRGAAISYLAVEVPFLASNGMLAVF